jgi:biotin operon repressor
VKIGLMVFLANDRADNSKRPYSTIRAIAQQAEADGFDSIWLADHLLYRNPGEPARGIWECWTTLAALAEATQRVEIGTLVLCSSFRNPAILAKMATTADEVSRGRLILGVGAGWNEPEYQAFGLPFDHRVSRFEEALQILRPLLQEGHVDFAGQYYQARNCDNVPRGPRSEGPPLMVGGEGPRMLKLAARYADLWNIGYMGKPETMAEPLAKSSGRETGILRKSTDRNGPGDGRGSARLRGTRRAAPNGSVRALHPGSAPAADRGAPALSRHGVVIGVACGWPLSVQAGIIGRVRAERLICLLLLLQVHGRMTAQQLSAELEVSVRTVYRDVQALQAAGIPLDGDAGHDGGYQLLGGYRTRLTGLTAAEAGALFLSGLPGPAAELGLGSLLAAAQLKMQAALPPALREHAGWLRERFHLNTPGWYAGAGDAAHLPLVADAVWNRRVIGVRYRRWTEPTEVTRRLKPYGLVLKASRDSTSQATGRHTWPISMTGSMPGRP